MRTVAIVAAVRLLRRERSVTVAERRITLGGVVLLATLGSELEVVVAGGRVVRFLLLEVEADFIVFLEAFFFSSMES